MAGPQRHSPMIAILVLLTGLVQDPTVAAAQHIPITTSGLGTTITRLPANGGAYLVSGGTRAGTNLFHSFGRFGIGVAETALFGDTAIPAARTTNIIGRVTGGGVSSIHGTVDTQFYPGASLFLINPAGVIVGPTASFAVSGSLHISTADYLGFDSGRRFYANPLRDTAVDSGLSVANPLAFGFLTWSPASIAFSGAVFPTVRAPTVSVVGGDVEIRSVSLSFGGGFQIASVRSPGEVGLTALTLTSFPRLGRVDIGPGSAIRLADNGFNGPGRTIRIRGGQILIDSSRMHVERAGDPTASILGIDLIATDGILVTNDSVLSTANVGLNRGGNVRLFAPVIEVTNRSGLESRTFGGGAGGNIAVAADSFVLASGARLHSDTTGEGTGGDVTLDIGRGLLVSGASMSSASSGSATARAGNIDILFDSTLAIKDSRISTSTVGAEGGNISISATGSLLHVVNSSITTSVQSGTGDGGLITLGSAMHPLGQIVLDGSRIAADAFGGPGASVGIFADVFLTRDSSLSSSSALSVPQPDTQTRHAGRLPDASFGRDPALAPASCRARAPGGRFSSLMVRGRDGIPPEPDGLLQSPLVSENLIGWDLGEAQRDGSVAQWSVLRIGGDSNCRQ